MKNILLVLKHRIIWSFKQAFTLKHFIAMIIFIMMFTIEGSEIPIEKLLLTLLFIGFCTYEHLLSALAVSLLLGAIIAVLPFLVFIIPILIIIGVFNQIKFFWNNKLALYLSVTVILMPSGIIQILLGDFYDFLVSPMDAILDGIYNSRLVYELSHFLDIPYEYIVYFIFFNLIMFTLYFMKYSASGALTAICMLPLLLVCILVPALINELTTALSSTSYYDYYPSDPGLHYVNGYERVNSSGNLEYVNGHVRTNPDGIEVNNLSYKE